MMAGRNKGESDRFECLERRLQALEDIEAIRNLKARYAALCDDHYDADGIAELFSEDAIWESPALGRFEGREMIRQSFAVSMRGITSKGKMRSMTSAWVWTEKVLPRL